MRARRLGERFDRPEDFDLASFWTGASAACERDAPRITVTLRLRPDRIERLMEALGSHAVQAAETLEASDPDGWTRLRVRVEWPDSAAAAFVRVGGDCEVLEPADLRDRVVRHAAGVLERYGALPAGVDPALADAIQRPDSITSRTGRDAPVTASSA